LVELPWTLRRIEEDLHMRVLVFDFTLLACSCDVGDSRLVLRVREEVLVYVAHVRRALFDTRAFFGFEAFFSIGAQNISVRFSPFMPVLFLSLTAAVVALKPPLDEIAVRNL
jgi:hypothetical protein